MATSDTLRDTIARWIGRRDRLIRSESPDVPEPFDAALDLLELLFVTQGLCRWLVLLDSDQAGSPGATEDHVYRMTSIQLKLYAVDAGGAERVATEIMEQIGGGAQWRIARVDPLD